MTTAIGAYATAALLKARMNITNTTDDTTLGLVCDQVNQYIETKARRVLAPVSSATFLIDGDGRDCFRFTRGIRAITDLSVSDVTGGTRIALASTDYFIRPLDQDRVPGFPATWVHLSDVGSRRSFPRGFATISMTATTGFAAIPDDVTELALVAAAKAWHALGTGQADIVGTDDMGRPIVSRYFSARDLETLRTYGTDLPG